MIYESKLNKIVTYLTKSLKKSWKMEMVFVFILKSKVYSVEEILVAVQEDDLVPQVLGQQPDFQTHFME